MDFGYDLIICGSPNGNQQWPNNDEELFCQQFFSLPTDAQNSSDFYIEIRTMEGNHRGSYYSYVHRKNLSGLVNGGKKKRNGAYFAMILKFNDAYCKSVRNLYALMDIAYKKYVLDNIIEESEDGESYLIESFESQTAILKKMEGFFTKSLGMLDLTPIDNHFSKAQSGKFSTMNLYEKSELAIISQFKNDLKLHLTIDCVDKEAALGDVKKELDKKTSDYKTLNSSYVKLKDNYNSLDEQNKQLQNDLKVAKQTNEENIKLISSLRNEFDHLQPLKDAILNCANEIRKNDNAKQSQNGSHKPSEESGNKEENNQLIKSKIRKYFPLIPWGGFLVCLLMLIFNATFSSTNKLESNVERLTAENNELKKNNEKLKEESNKSIKALNDTIDVYKGKINAVSVLLANISSINKTPKATDLKPWDYLNIVGYKDKIKGKATVNKKNENGVVRWDVIDGKEFVKIDGDTIKCIKNGTITIIGYDKNGKEIEASRRSNISVEMQ